MIYSHHFAWFHRIRTKSSPTESFFDLHLDSTNSNSISNLNLNFKFEFEFEFKFEFQIQIFNSKKISFLNSVFRF